MADRQLHLAQPLVHIREVVVGFRVARVELKYLEVALDRLGILACRVELISQREMRVEMIGPSRYRAPEMFDGLGIPAESLQQHRIGVMDAGMVGGERKG